MQEFFQARKDPIYDLLKSQMANWRQFHQLMALKVYRSLGLNRNQISAFVVGNTVKVGLGKKMEGVNRHYDHTLGRCVMGLQMVQLGLLFHPAKLTKAHLQITAAHFNDSRCFSHNYVHCHNFVNLLFRITDVF